MTDLVKQASGKITSCHVRCGLRKPEDIFTYTLFLASDELSGITGANLNIIGGSRVAA